MIAIVLRSFTSPGAATAAMRDEPEAIFVQARRYGRHQAGIGRGGVWISADAATIRLTLALIGRRGGRIGRPEAIEILFGHRADGGPERADEELWRRWASAKLALAAIGFVGEADGLGLRAQPGGEAVSPTRPLVPV